MKLFLSALLGFLFFTSAQAQNSFIVTGHVIAKETGLPLQGASVFAQNTTMGTATDKDGNFKLYLPPGGYDLVVTFTGYNADSRRVSSAEAPTDMNFVIAQKEKEMADVAIVASSEVKDGWQKYGSFFLDEFIGNTANSKACVVTNPEVLKFYFSKKKNRLKVMAAEPLHIENKSLGYNITYTLDSFVHEYNTDLSVYTGYPLYEEMPGTIDLRAQWAEARAAAYNGSMLQFMRSIYMRRLATDGFEMQFIVQAGGKDSALILKDAYAAVNYKRDDSTGVVEIYPNQPTVGVLYTKSKPSPAYLANNPGEPSGFQFSLVAFRPEQSIMVEPNGYYYEQNAVSVSGYWGWTKLADQLPYDYGQASDTTHHLIP